MRETLFLNAFHMNTACHFYDGGWRNPQDRQVEFSTLGLWKDVVRALERGRFDNVFFADAMGTDAAYGNSWDIYAKMGVHFPVHDPMTLAAALISETENLGLTFTNSTIQEPPFNFAKRISTLDHLSGGRIGWNIVTGHTVNGANNLGQDGLLPHDERYEMAEEYVDVLYKLWEGSWDEDSLPLDKVAGVFADPDKIHKINHRGKWFKVEGPHLVTPSPQRTPILFQAGASKVGRAFAARHAEAAFVLCLTPESMRTARQGMDELLKANGRDPDDLLLVQGMSFVVGSTEEEAKRKAAEQARYLNLDALAARVSRDLGLDISGADADTPLDEVKTEAVKGTIALLQEAMHGQSPKVSDLPRLYSVRLVGTPEQIADELTVWRDAGMGGINMAAMVLPQTDIDFVDYVVPELQRRGLSQKEYRPGTLREKLFPGRPAYINDRHPASRLRGAFSAA
jgi:FMN-dependent oxidoreductase (nitrilotriacetate monooxygenase family)